MKINIYDQQGKEMGQALLPKEIFSVEPNHDLIHQVAVSQMANRRQVVAHTKNRGDVRGGGRKPWAQKGTGRARHGSRRSPLWKGGGVTFGPTKERVFKKKINIKMKRKALFMVLSAKAKNNFIILLDDLQIEKPKTKLVARIFEKLPSKGKSVLFVLPTYDKNIIKAAQNLANVGIIQAKDLNALDALNFQYLVMPKTAIKVIKETFLEKSEARNPKSQTNSNDQNSKSKTV